MVPVRWLRYRALVVLKLGKDATMHTVAPIWRVAALMIPLASLVGCDWLPVRRRIDPAHYPVPTRPDPGLIQGHRKSVHRHPSPDPSDSPVLAGLDGNRPLPPLPELVPVSPEELFGPPPPTPILDAALVRAEAVRSAVFEELPESQVDPSETPETIAPAGEPLDLETGQVGDVGDAPELQGEIVPSLQTEPFEVPPIPESLHDGTDSTGLDDPDDGQSDTPGDAERATSEVAEGQDPLIPLAGQPTEMGGEEDTEGVDRSDDSPSTRLRNAKADAEGTVGNDENLWLTVMQLLADPEPEAPSSPIDDQNPEPNSSLRVSRVAFCREVMGFDRIKTFSADSFKSGQDVLIYCEMEQVHSILENEEYVSRLSTTLEVVPDVDGPALWSNVLLVEDRCTRPRHDYFVGYRLTLPDSLAPGRYRLRVEQRDVHTGQQATGEVPFVIVSGGR